MSFSLPAGMLNIQPISALLALAFQIHIRVRRQVDDLNELGSGKFACAT
jgi:hypothetical protein